MSKTNLYVTLYDWHSFRVSIANFFLLTKVSHQQFHARSELWRSYRDIAHLRSLWSSRNYC